MDNGADAGAQAGDQTSIVIIDDEPDLVFLLERVLAQHGYTVAGTAADGREGIQRVAEAQPDVVLLDLAMPTLDGEGALPTIVLDAPRTMIVILSAHVTPERARSLFEHGAFAVYEKADLGAVPAALEEDLALFRRVLAGEDAMPSLRRRYQRP